MIVSIARLNSTRHQSSSLPPPPLSHLPRLSKSPFLLLFLYSRLPPRNLYTHPLLFLLLLLPPRSPRPLLPLTLTYSAKNPYINAPSTFSSSFSFSSSVSISSTSFSRTHFILPKNVSAEGILQSYNYPRSQTRRIASETFCVSVNWSLRWQTIAISFNPISTCSHCIIYFCH